MYNKLFTKILDSSIWLTSESVRLVWITLIASMDEDGYCHFSAVQNLALRARVSLDEAEKAVDVLMSPDPDSADPSNEGRRLQRVPGGFIVLNSEKHRSIITRSEQREATRLRVAKHRAKKKGNNSVTVGNENVTSSDTDTDTNTGTKRGKNALPENLNLSAWQEWVDYRKTRKLPTYKTTQKAVELAAITTESQLECVRYSTGNNYNGLFPDKFSGVEKQAQKSNFDKQTDTLKEWLSEQPS